MKDKQRVDAALVERGLCESRTKAQACVMAGEVYIGENKVLKSSETVLPQQELTLRRKTKAFASRGGYKLEKALKAFGADVRGCVCMDIGAATGGFTDVLLQNGAAHVYAIDVGYGQFDWRLRQDERVTLMERTNARLLQPADLPLRPTVTVMDVSFISIRLILPVAAAIMGEAGRFYTLIKPQFEVGKDRVGKKGVVRDLKLHEEVLQAVVDFAPSIGYHVDSMTYSPITGPEGNIEFLGCLLPGMEQSPMDAAAIRQLVAEAHDRLRHGTEEPTPERSKT